MKKLTKILLAVGGAALICGGSVMTYLKAQTRQVEMSDLTLQNLEALASPFDMDPANVGPAQLIECPSNCEVAIGKYCLGSKDGGPCMDIPCMRKHGFGDDWII